MTGTELIEKVGGIFREVLDNEKLVIARDTTADDVEEWDSLAHISLIVAIEKEFGIKFLLTELKTMKNIGDLLDVIEGKMA